MRRLVFGHAELLRDVAQLLVVERLANVRRLDWLVRALRDPRLSLCSLAGLLQAAEDLLQPTVHEQRGHEWQQHLEHRVPAAEAAPVAAASAAEDPSEHAAEPSAAEPAEQVA